MDSVEKVQNLLKTTEIQKTQQEMQLVKVNQLKQMLEKNVDQLEGAIIACKNLLKDTKNTTEAE